jgi:serine/threonine protein kinase
MEEIQNEIRIHNITREHPRFVKLMKAYESEDHISMVLEHYEGGTLYDMIA